MPDLKPAGILLDRDGVIIQNRSEYVLHEKDIEFIPGSIAAIVNAAKLDRPILIITNQSAIGRGLLSMESAELINKFIVDRIEAKGGRIDEVYMCPHHPQENCACRKPEPGLIIQAVEEYNLDLERSIMIGDAASDLAAGRNAGIGTLVLVRTGRGAGQEKLARGAGIGNFAVHNDLSQALSALLPLSNSSVK